MRKLVSIQKVHSIRPIDGADAIEAVSVQGWHLVAKKGEFQNGDLCVFFEIDSVLPDLKTKKELAGEEVTDDDLVFEFMRNRKFKVKTIKLRGQISQGLAIPPSNFPQLNGMRLVEDMELTDRLGVRKYDPEAESLINGTGTKFKEGIRKTDETRVQSMKKSLSKVEGIDGYIAEKMEGSSTTFYLVDNVFGVCSRNLDVDANPERLDDRWKLALEHNVEQIMRDYDAKNGIGNFAIQAEMIGPGIQGNIYGLDKKEFRIFTFFKEREQRYSTYDELIHLIEETGLPLVPIIDDNFTITSDVDALVELSIGNSKIANRSREGIVIRSKDYTESGEIFSCKAINPNYLLKQK
jgi:RNA ligase (TIGR02306 family)